MNAWQLKQLKKFKLEKSDIKTIKTPYLKVHDWKNTHHEFAEFKHYPCKGKCWQYTLLGFIEMLEWKCKDCFWFDK